MLLSDSVVVVTGMGPGLGQELGKAFVREGAKVAICCRNEEYLEEQAQQLRASGAEIIAMPVDITVREQCDRFIEKIISQWGRIDALVNSAYNPGPYVSFEEANLDDWRLPFEVNVLGSLNMTQAALPGLKAAGSASVVNINSMIQRKPLQNQAAYAASKGALSAATKALAVELGPLGIRVNNVMMGWMWGYPVESSLQAAADAQGIPLEQITSQISAGIPLGYIPEDGDCANAVVFLASSLSKVVNGATLDVNGGEFMP